MVDRSWDIIKCSGVVEISKEYLDELLDESFLLNCLRNAGVDNWEGWDYAIEVYNKEANE